MKIVVIGGGAAGMMAACTAAERGAERAQRALSAGDV